MARLTVVVLLVLCSIAPVAMAQGPPWSVSVTGTHHYVGDAVELNVVSHYSYGGDYVNMVVYDPMGARIHLDYIQLDRSGVGNYTWQSNLMSDPGVYIIEVSHSGAVVCELEVELVFDELDYLGKYSVWLEARIEAQDDKLETIEERAIRTELKVNYMLRWWVFTTIVCAVNIIVLAIVGPRAYYAHLLKFFRTRSETMGNLRAAFMPQTDRNQRLIPGHEDLAHDLPDWVRTAQEEGKGTRRRRRVLR